MCVAGNIAGPEGCVVKIQDALKKPWPKNVEKVEDKQLRGQGQAAEEVKAEV